MIFSLKNWVKEGSNTVIAFLLVFFFCCSISATADEEGDSKPLSIQDRIRQLAQSGLQLSVQPALDLPSIAARRRVFETFHLTGQMPLSDSSLAQESYAPEEKLDLPSIAARRQAFKKFHLTGEKIESDSSVPQKSYTPYEQEVLLSQVLFHPHIAYEIIKYLNQADIYALRATCKAGHQVYQLNAPTLVFNLDFLAPDWPLQTYGDEQLLNSLLSFLEYSRRGINRLVLTSPSFPRLLKHLTEASVVLSKTRSICLKNTALQNVTLRHLSNIPGLRHFNASNPDRDNPAENPFSNKITSCVPFRFTPHLHTLNLAGNQVSSLDGLEILTSLKVLNLDRNPLSLNALPPISQLRDLEEFSLSWDGINEEYRLETMDFLAGLSLVSLNLNGHGISDASLLESHHRLRHLNMGNNHLTHLKFLENLSQLESLFLEKNTHTVLVNDEVVELALTDISSLALLNNLQQLNLAYNGITDLSPLAGLRSLLSLNVSHNQIRSIEALKPLITLQKLNIQQNPLELGNINALASLKDLKNLDISNTQVTNISPLKHVTGLMWLYASQNQITNLIYLESHQELIHLSISDNPIRDLEPLARLPKLLTLEADKIGHLFLMKLPRSLRFLSLRANNLTDRDDFDRKLQLFSLNLEGNSLSATYIKQLQDSGIAEEIIF